MFNSAVIIIQLGFVSIKQTITAKSYKSLGTVTVQQFICPSSRDKGYCSSGYTHLLLTSLPLPAGDAPNCLLTAFRNDTHTLQEMDSVVWPHVCNVMLG
jgi:hypothetical protein